MISAARFNFSPVRSLSLARHAAAVARRSAMATPGYQPRPAAVSPAATTPGGAVFGPLWDRSILDHLRAPLTRFHE